MTYSEDEYLQLSGIQHFAFCRRQWALAHIERQWQDNYLTIAGDLMHKRVDDPYISETRGSKFIVRAMPIHSREYGISGKCDAVEFLKDKNGVNVYGKQGKYLPIPVEYKHGKEKSDHSDKLQLLGEALCLEEMLFCHVEYGYLYYGKIRHREKVKFTESLRQEFEKDINEMHAYWKKKYTPRVKPSDRCKSCSLREICLPELLKSENVHSYIKRRLNE
ncbi:CRISPR-associated exonuclease Cas4 [Lactobacillus colini]|uniref:CRISPR-associated exonuclease Cas4 n=1 Tax=Lactobacillus colini TaxID=1819254 RepID=A0ABS4MH15_9LACO|nr:CRISPR-associated protein Cas4 [Lactobacillus colini]MBP2058972.1 CRISPR-associated exonuclease Cas4 [Lactobacillus colini]